jgi:serine protease Do
MIGINRSMRLKAFAGVTLALAMLVVSVAAQSRNPGMTQIFPEMEGSGAYLGIQMEDVTASNMAAHKLNAERGVIIRSVEKGSPAESAKLQENDVILEYCGIPVISAAQFSRMIRETPPGRMVDLALSRDGKKLPLTAKLGEQHSPEEAYRNLDRNFYFQGPGGRTFPYRIQPRNVVPMPNRAPEKPRLGVTLQPVTDQMAEFLGVTAKSGAMVTAVEPGSPAAGKLKAGDVVVSADGKRVASPEDLSQAVQQNSGKLGLKVIRDKKEIAVSIDLPSGPLKL